MVKKLFRQLLALIDLLLVVPTILSALVLKFARRISAVNYLKHHHFQELKATCPFLHTKREPGSFYIQRVE